MGDQYLAFDLGAGSGRAVLGELENELLTLSELHRFPNNMLEIDDHLHWNTPYMLEEMINSLKICAEKHGPPSCIGVDSWGVDFALLNRNDELVSLPYTYRDKRTEGVLADFSKKYSLRRLYKLTGIQNLPFDTLMQIYSMIRDKRPELTSATCLLMIADLFNFHFTGLKSTEYTLSTTSHLINSKTRNWEREILDTAGIHNIMQEIHQPGKILGFLNQPTQIKTGLGKVPVANVASHDTASAVVSVPAEIGKFAYISSGTWSLMGVETKKPVISKLAMEYNFTNEGGVSGTIRLLKNITGLWILERCMKAWSLSGNLGYTELIEKARRVKPFKSIIYTDWIGFHNPSSMPSAIVEFCRKTRQPPPKSQGEYVRTILESLTLAYKNTLEQLEEVTGQKIRNIHIIGGGSQNEFLCSLTADSTQRDIYSGPVEATSIGNIMMQAISLERVKNLTEARKIIKNSFKLRHYKPHNLAGWEDAYTRFLQISGEGGSI